MERIAGGLSQKQSAKRLVVDPGTLARWERGEREPTEAFLSRVKRSLRTRRHPIRGASASLVSLIGPRDRANFAPSGSGSETQFISAPKLYFGRRIVFVGPVSFISAIGIAPLRTGLPRTR
jgi:transcriptional regulator with XRE-family HTH domain